MEAPMTGNSDRSTRWQLVHDVVVFQVKLGLEAVLDLALIPTSLAAAAVDFLAGNWRRPRHFHAVLRFGERCETAINLWGVATKGVDERPAAVDAVMHSIEAVIRDPSTGPERVRMLRRWAALKLAGSDADALRPGNIDEIPSEQRDSK
jgi:hypothetical protein